MKYEILVDTIQKTHQHFQQQAAKAVNVSLTLRNWLIGVQFHNVVGGFSPPFERSGGVAGTELEGRA